LIGEIFMSLETWKAEFYPTPAAECPAHKAVAHALRKWTGLRTENLARHGLYREKDYSSIRFYGSRDESAARMVISSDNCALCVHYIDDSCTGCPLRDALDDKCYAHATGQTLSPWAEWIDNHDPEPMIAALTALLVQGVVNHVLAQNGDHMFSEPDPEKINETLLTSAGVECYAVTIQLVADDKGGHHYRATVRELPHVAEHADTPQAAYDRALDTISVLRKAAQKEGRPFPNPIMEIDE
jgi:predicted RNase H-like HicB family nuclease